MTIRAELDNMRERVEGATERAGNGFPMALEECARTDLPRLLDAVEAALRVADALEVIATESSISARILGPSFKEVARNIRDAISTALEGK